MMRHQPERAFDSAPVFWLLIVFVCMTMQACASTARSDSHTRLVREHLHPRIQDILGRPELAQATVGIKVVSLWTGETLFEQNADRLFNPASNTKLFTAVGALKTLGPHYHFTTTLSLDSGFFIANDSLYTSLYLKGTGDGLLETLDLHSLIEPLLLFDIHTVVGDIIVDDTRFDDRRLGTGWMWDDVEYGFSAQLSALTVNANSVTVIVAPGDMIDAPVDVRLEPPTSYMQVRVQATTVSAGTPDSVLVPLRIERQWQRRENVVVVTGQMPLGSYERRVTRTVEDPSLYAGTLFRELIEAEGVGVTGHVRRGTAAQAYEIAAHDADSLTAALTFMLKDSDNLTAELLIKAMAADQYGPPGTTEQGMKLIRQIMTETTGLDTLRYLLVDGSGLSLYNLVTPAQVTELLRYVYDDPMLRDTIWSALPLAGVDGKLKYRMRLSAAYRKLMAKTGTMSGVSCLSGFVHTRDDEPLAFSIMMNHYVGSARAFRQAQDDIGAALAGFSRRPHLAGR